jgi:hypothetical protein
VRRESQPVGETAKDAHDGDPSGEPQNQSDGGHDALELGFLGGELLSSRGRQCMVPCATIVVGHAPLGLDIPVER